MNSIEIGNVLMYVCAVCLCVFGYRIWFENTIWLYFINPCAEAIGFKFSLQCLSIGLDEIRQDKNVVEQKSATGERTVNVCESEQDQHSLHTRLEDTQTNKHTHIWVYLCVILRRI